MGEIGGASMHFPPFLPQQLLQSLVAVAAVFLLALGTITSLVIWARLHGDLDRFAFVAAVTSVGGLAVMVNVLFPVLGWWGGPVFAGPLLPLALLTGVRAMFQLSLVLLLYRWLASRRQWLALLIYSLILLALIPGTIRGDQHFLHSGVLTFGNGYTIWYDVLLGEVFFLLPVILYESCRCWLSNAHHAGRHPRHSFDLMV